MQINQLVDPFETAFVAWAHYRAHYVGSGALDRLPQPALTELMRPIDPAIACRRLVDGEDLERVTAGLRGDARSLLLGGVVALLRPRPGRTTAGERSDVVARALVARARRLT